MEIRANECEILPLLYFYQRIPSPISYRQNKMNVALLSMEKKFVIISKMKAEINNKGLTLVEVAIVLVILGLLIGLGASLIGPLTKRAKLNETKEIVSAAVESVIGFGAKNYRLPTTSEFPQQVRTSKDAWGKDLLYFVDTNLITAPQNPAEGICGKKETQLIVCRDANCTSQIPNVAFLVVSGGENFNIQTGPLTSSPCPTGKTCYRVYDQGTAGVDDYPNDFSRQEEYDDIVKWVTIDELRIKAGCQGAPLKILNNELPYGYVGSQYNATVYAEGGVPFQSGGKYKWCIQRNPASAPSNLYFKDQNDSNDITFSTDCNSLQESNWTQADYIKISGTPSTQGSFSLTFFVRDNQDPNNNQDNIAQKTLVLTINPQTSSSSGGPIGAQVSFANNIGQFNQAESNQSAVQINTSNNTIVLGGGVNSAYGCSWFPTSYTLSGKTMRAYFQFKTLYQDTSQDSTTYADGYTFALIDANAPPNVCGGAGCDIGFHGIPYQSIALEIDFWRNCNGYACPEKNDPFSYGNYANHVALVFNGDNRHGVNPNPLCSATSPAGCIYKTGSPTWLEDGAIHTVRMEIHTKCNSPCTNCGLGGNNNNALIKVWIDCSNCNDLTQNFSSSPDLQYCYSLPSQLNNVKFGFTEATGGMTQIIELSNFGIGFY